VKRIAIQMCVLLGLATIAGFAAKAFHPYAPAMYLVVEQPGEGEVLAADAMVWHHQGLVVWIDARKKEAYDARHAPDAFLLNEFNFDEQLFEIYTDLANLSDKRFVVYCGSYSCKASENIAKALREKGFQEVYSVKDGWKGMEMALDKAKL
jgi:rhodanese-related sulfurtransferase